MIDSDEAFSNGKSQLKMDPGNRGNNYFSF